MRVGLVIPTLNAGRELDALLDAVKNQTRRPDDVLVVDSSSDDNTVEIVKSRPGVRAMSIHREDFDHGGTRQLALGEVAGDFILFLTQDAIPADERYIENLLRPFEDPEVAMTSGRQLPKPDARRYIQLVQEFNYPAVPNVRSESDIEKLGIRAFFASDACSAYRRSALDTIGGVPRPCATNEDMLAAARLLRAGYKVVYAADARVFHSHNLTPYKQFLRNRAIGAFLVEHADALDVPSEVVEGVGLVKSVAAQLASEGRADELLAFGVDCFARLLGNVIGKKSALRQQNA